MRFLLLALIAVGSMAEAQVFKCTDAAGKVAYQSRPCADGAAAETVKIRAAPDAPPPLPEPPADDVNVSQAASEKPAPQVTSPPPRQRPMSWRCTSPDTGEVWYQHTRCPLTTLRMEYIALGNGRLGPSINVERPVQAEEVSRDDACEEINRPGAASRKGSERDEKASPYDKAQGRDLC